MDAVSLCNFIWCDDKRKCVMKVNCFEQGMSKLRLHIRPFQGDTVTCQSRKRTGVINDMKMGEFHSTFLKRHH